MVDYRGDEFYTPEDDADLNPNPFDLPPSPNPYRPPSPFDFEDYSFARKVREVVKNTLITFDKNKNKQFSQGEI